MEIEKIPVFPQTIVLEGGSIHVDGKGKKFEHFFFQVLNLESMKSGIAREQNC